MRSSIFVCVLVTATALGVQAHSQQNSGDTLRIYNQQAGDKNWKRRDWREFKKYDFNSFERGEQKYFADRYYRDGRFYQKAELGDSDRIYRGQNKKYYCRRSDGTTGFVFGIPDAGKRGSILQAGQSDTLESLRRTKSGAPLGLLIDRNKLICR